MEDQDDGASVRGLKSTPLLVTCRILYFAVFSRKKRKNSCVKSSFQSSVGLMCSSPN
jgi:hypothetical protein